MLNGQFNAALVAFFFIVTWKWVLVMYLFLLFSF